MRFLRLCPFPFSDNRSRMVLGPVTFPAEVHVATVFALRNGKFSKLGGGEVSHPNTPLTFVPKYTAPYVFSCGIVLQQKRVRNL